MTRLRTHPRYFPLARIPLLISSETDKRDDSFCVL